MTPHPAQLTLDGTPHHEALRRVAARRRRQQLDAWVSALTEPRTVAELAFAWWPEVGDPRGWEVGRYPCGFIAAARHRVRALVAAGMVVVGAGGLKHRRQEGVVVMRVRGGQRKLGGGRE